jgi:hypothetical protein
LCGCAIAQHALTRTKRSKAKRAQDSADGKLAAANTSEHNAEDVRRRERRGNGGRRQKGEPEETEDQGDNAAGTTEERSHGWFPLECKSHGLAVLRADALSGAALFTKTTLGEPPNA